MQAGTIHDLIGALEARFAEVLQRVANMEAQMKELTDSVVEIAAAKTPDDKSSRSSRGD